MTMTNSLGQGLAHILGPRIVSGEMTEPTTTDDLVREYSVSRTTVRDALAMLRDKGLVTALSGVGVTPCGREKWDLTDPDVLRWLLPGDSELTNEALGLVTVINEFSGGPLSEALRRMLEEALA
jgi:DNA-binding FadR family transcriptional regulator